MNGLGELADLGALAVIAATGVAAGYRRRDPVPVEPPADPLEDRRIALVRSMADLDEAHASGLLAEEEYRRLRRDSEGRMARVSAAVEARRAAAVAASGPAASAIPATDNGGSSAPPARAPGRVPPWAVAILLVATIGSVLVVGLLRDSGSSGTPAGPLASSQNPFSFFERRVREHPDDVAARLDLAKRYLDAGRLDDALAQYTAALELRPDDAEAHANVGLILFQAGRVEKGLDEVDRALEAEPDYPEALLYRGVILLRGLDRPGAAIESLRRYLDAAPFGSERATARDLIAEARAALEG